jgi:hypothetical protein
MIQRIQSVYLLLTTLLSALFLSGNIITFTGAETTFIKITLSGIYLSTGGTEEMTYRGVFMILPVFLSSIISLVAILTFKKRKIQLWLTRLIMAFILTGIMAGAYYIVILTKKYNVQPEIGFRLFIPPVIVVLAFLASRGIIHDEKLVRSYDRLR